MTPARGAAAPPPAEMPSQTPALSAQRVSNVQKYVVLLDWWLERVEGSESKIRVAGFTQTPQMRKGASSSKRNKQLAGRVFRSSNIVRRKDDAVIEAEDGYLIRICRVLNIQKTRANGFSQEVCERFEFGFPSDWHRFVNPNMEPENKHAHTSSESSQPPANGSSHSVEYYTKMFLSDSFIYSGHAFTEIDPSWGLFGLRMDMPEENDQRESMRIDASEQDASPLPAEGTTSQYGTVQGSEDNTVRRLRSGKVLGMLSAEPKKRGHKQKKVQHESVPDKM